MLVDRSMTLVAAEKRAFFSGSARLPGSSCLRPPLRTEVASLMSVGFSTGRWNEISLPEHETAQMDSREERTWPGRVGGEVNASFFEALASAGRQLLGQVDRDGALDGVRHVDDELVGVRESRSRMKNKKG